MKPYNPFQGPAPAAMAQMGQGLIEAGANIGKTLQSGYESMGKGIASGITSAAGSIAAAMGEKKQLESSIKSSEKFYDSIKDSIDPTVRKGFDNQIAAINADTSLSTRDKAMFWNDAKSFIGGAVSNQFKMNQMQQEMQNRIQLQSMQEAAAAGRQQEALQAQERENIFKSGAVISKPVQGFGGGSMFIPRNPLDNFTPNTYQGETIQRR